LSGRVLSLDTSVVVGGSASVGLLLAHRRGKRVSLFLGG
jgi:hypothetical protein